MNQDAQEEANNPTQTEANTNTAKVNNPTANQQTANEPPPNPPEHPSEPDIEVDNDNHNTQKMSQEGRERYLQCRAPLQRDV